MKTFATLLFAAITSFASLVQSSDSHPNSLVQVRVVRVDLQQVTSDYIRFAMVMRIKSSHSARLRRIRFSEMRWGSLPFFLSPIEEKVHLTPGEDLILPPIPVTFYFRDLDTLQPLEDSLRNQEITVSGRARAELDLSPLERIALLQWSGQFEIPVQSSFPLTVPGGQLGRTAAIASVRASELALALGGSALNLVRTEQMDRADEVNRLYRSALVVAEYRYAVMLRDGQRIDFKGKSLGFLLKPNKVLLTAETVEPWKYDSDVASLLESKQARLV